MPFNNHNPVAVRLQPDRYRWALGATALLNVLPFAAIPLGGMHIGHFTFLDSYWLGALALAYDIATINSVETDEFAGITVLERPAIETDSGVKFVPFGLAKLHRVPRGLQEDQLPGEPEQISKLPDEQETDPNKLKPMRIVTAGSKPGDDDSDMLASRLTLEPTAAVVWQVKERGFFKFFINIDGKTWPEKRAFLVKQMRDTVEAQLQIEFGQHLPTDLYQNTEAIAENVRNVLAEKMSTWGITICSLTLQNLEPDHATNTAMGLVPAARARRAAEIHDAEGRKAATILVSEGNLAAAENTAKARVITMRAEGEGTKAEADAIGMTGEALTMLKLGTAALGRGTTYLGVPALTQIAAVSRAILGQKEEASQ